MSHDLSELHDLPKTGIGGTFTSSRSPPFRLGDEAFLKCEMGYKRPHRPLSRVVSENGRLIWEPAEIDCLPISELNALPETGKGGRFICSRSSAPYHVGDTAVLQCDLGFHVPNASTSTVVLKNGLLTWEPPSIHCNPVQCREPFIPAHGDVSSRQYFFPNFFTYVCQEGYELNQPVRKHYCAVSGNWSPAPSGVACQPVRCPPLKAPLHGSVTHYDTAFRSVATFRCDRDYIMIRGKIKRVCQADGTWSGEEVECAKFPCPPMPSSVSAISLNDFAIVRCDGDRTVNVKCLPTGQWSLQFPYCDGIPTVPALPQNIPTGDPPDIHANANPSSPALAPTPPTPPHDVLPQAKPPSPVSPPTSPPANPSSPASPFVPPSLLPHPTVAPARPSRFVFVWILFALALVIWISSLWWNLKG